MKKLLLALFVLGSTAAFCQTTDDEYNYLTKGYSVQVSSGLDMKQGYSLTDKGTTPMGPLNVDVRYLYRTNGNVYAGALLMISGLKGPKGADMGTQYFCIPAPGSPMTQWNDMVGSIRKACGSDKSGYEAIMFALMHVIPN